MTAEACTEKKYVVTWQKEDRELLPESVFLHAHRSFIINKSEISHIEGNRVFIHTTETPIGSNYKDVLMTELGFSKE